MYGVAKSDEGKHSLEDKIWKLESESGNLYQKPQREQNDTPASKELLQSPKIVEIKHTLLDQLQNQNIDSVNLDQKPQWEQ